MAETMPQATMKGPTKSPLPREVVKWLQSLDLSFMVKNPKRDFCNGFLVAEILSRYYPKDVNMNSFENGTRLAAKVDNWEQLYRLFNRLEGLKDLHVSKQEIDAVIHCAQDAALGFLFHLYHVLTKRTVKVFDPQTTDLPEQTVPAYARDTASKRLKDDSIARIQDNIERTIRAIDVLGSYHQERRVQKANEAPFLIQQNRAHMISEHPDYDVSSKEEVQDSLQMSEVRVKALTGSAPALQGKGSKLPDGQRHKAAASAKQALLKAVTEPQTSVGALAGIQQPALFVKPATDIMKPLVLSIVQESEELNRMIDARKEKDIIVSFMEQCREGMPADQRGESQEQHKERMRQIEETSVKVFETLANRAQLLVDTLTKSPPEFWKVWSTFFPALTDFPESSPVFESAVFLFKRIGQLMREADAPLTQTLITEVGLPSLSKELARSPEKRECMCEIIYSYAQEDTLNHLLVLRALKEKVRDDLPVYISCLSCLITLDAQLNLLDEHLLDLYIYYALMATQSAQPRVRVAGISILSTITTCSAQHHSVVALIPQFDALAADEWWEVQAQLLLLSANLLSKLSLGERPDSGSCEDGVSGSGSRIAGDAHDAGFGMSDARRALLHIIKSLFVVGASKNVLQVGLSALVHLLSEFEDLQPVYITVLLSQPSADRQRLLRPAGDEGDFTGGRKPYVQGNSSRTYEEKCISKLWPHLEVGKTLVRTFSSSEFVRLQPPHLEVLLATLPEEFEESEAEEWPGLYEQAAQHVFDALITPDLHLQAAQFIRHFWTCQNEHIAATSAEKSRGPLIKALQALHSPSDQPKVKEVSISEFLRDLKNSVGGVVAVEVTSAVESFRESFPDEYRHSSLSKVLL